MLKTLKATSPTSIVALLTLVIGGFIFAKQFSYHLVNIFFPGPYKMDYFMDVLSGLGGWSTHISVILLVASIIILYKKKEIINSKKAIANVIVMIFTLSSAMVLSFELFSPLYAINSKIFGSYGWGYHVAFIMFIAGVIYLFRQNELTEKHPNQTVLMNKFTKDNN